jgi:hypothetical protein
MSSCLQTGRIHRFCIQSLPAQERSQNEGLKPWKIGTSTDLVSAGQAQVMC